MTEWIENPNNFFLVAELPAHGIVGAALYRRNEAAISLCYLAPEGLHRGIGSKLLSGLETEAKRLKQQEITLSSSITARGFYARHGYKENGEPAYAGKIKSFPMRKILAETMEAEDSCK